MTTQELAHSAAIAMKEDRSTDCYLMGLPIPGVSTTDVAKVVAKELQRIGILKSGWIIIGRNKIQGYYDREVLEELTQPK